MEIFLKLFTCVAITSTPHVYVNDIVFLLKNWSLPKQTQIVGRVTSERTGCWCVHSAAIPDEVS